jgi:internalin A
MPNDLTCLPPAIAALVDLVRLTLNSNPISDFAPLRDLQALQHLDCSRTQVSDLTPLKELQVLQSLDCSRTQVSNLTPLKELHTLRQLNCSDTAVSDLRPLIGLASLHALVANNCRLHDLPRILLTNDTLTSLMLHETAVPVVPGEVLSEDRYTSCLKRLRDLWCAKTRDVRMSSRYHAD